jgi:formylglycine-generating enzyme required for sulfatase activity
MNLVKLVLVLSACARFFEVAHAVTIDTVPVGNMGNAADDTGIGSVGYDYLIGKYEVTNAQYVEFLNTIDPSGINTLALYSTSMSTDARGGILFNPNAANGSKYVIKSGRDNNPVVFVSWYDSIRFANWLHNGQGSGSTETGAYTMLGGTATPTNGDSIARNPGARWFLPRADEWYKAAFHKNDGVTGNYWNYPTATDAEPYSDQPPGSGAPTQSKTANFYKSDGAANGYDDGYAVTGSTTFAFSQNYLSNVGAYTLSASPYGTFDQAGNAAEWHEALLSTGMYRGTGGGGWTSPVHELASSILSFALPTGEFNTAGFRVASIPTPIGIGDFNDDGTVDAADYVVWRKNGGTQEEFETWRANFGATAGSGALSNTEVPAPASALLLLLGTALVTFRGRQLAFGVPSTH